MATPPNELEARKRNIERRRETSRFAARDRRGKEADIFTDLKEVVPVVNEATVTHVDRIALLRVAATLCRLRKTASEVLRNDLADEVLNGPVSEETISEAFDGFVVLADGDGSIVYVTESVALYLGLTQTDLTGRNLKEFMHPTDYDEFIRMQGEMSGNASRKPDPCSTILRLKTVISPRGRNLNLKSALYKPISFLIQMRRSHSNVVMVMQGCSIPAGVGSINATANAITKGAEAPNGAFMTRHTCDMKISYVSDAFTYILKGPNPKTENRTLMGSSFYDLVHPSDAHIVHKSMRELFAKGHTRTPYYRLIASNRTLAWVMTEATTINHTTRGQKGQYVICVHFVLGIQGESESLVVCTDEIPAGIPVLKKIKAEIVDQMEVDVLPPQQVHVADPLRGRQPDVMECVDFTPLIADTNSVGYPNPVAAAGKSRLAALQQEKNDERRARKLDQRRRERNRDNAEDFEFVTLEDDCDYTNQMDNPLVEVDAQINYFNASSAVDVDLTPMEGFVPIPLPVVDTVEADLAELFGDDERMSTVRGEWSAVGSAESSQTRREGSSQTRREERDKEVSRECPIEREAWARGAPPLQPLGRILKRIQQSDGLVEERKEQNITTMTSSSGRTVLLESRTDLTSTRDRGRINDDPHLEKSDVPRKKTIENTREPQFWKWKVVVGGHEADVESEAEIKPKQRIMRRRKRISKMTQESNKQPSSDKSDVVEQQNLKRQQNKSELEEVARHMQDRQDDNLTEIDGRAPVLQTQRVPFGMTRKSSEESPEVRDCDADEGFEVRYFFGQLSPFVCNVSNVICFSCGCVL